MTANDALRQLKSAGTLISESQIVTEIVLPFTTIVPGPPPGSPPVTSTNPPP
jgi:hypothetical protein